MPYRLRSLSTDYGTNAAPGLTLSETMTAILPALVGMAAVALVALLMLV